MRIFRQLVWKFLRANRMRTAATIVGIALSMSLLTAVIEGAVSGVRYLREVEIEKNGSYDLIRSDLNAQEAERLSQLDGVKQYSRITEVGWANIHSTNDEKPYLYIQSAEDNLKDLIALHLTEGRMPDKADQILLPEHLEKQGGVKYQLGDALTLQVGTRSVNGQRALANASLGHREEGEDANKAEEKLVDLHEQTYQVVGFYKKPSADLESYFCPGYTALTCRAAGDGRYTVALTIRQPEKIHAWMNEHPDLLKKAKIHKNLLQFYGVIGKESWRIMLYGFVIVLLVMVVFGSFSLIYHAFSISLSERTRKYGMLRSIGATRRQIRASVFYEAGILSLVGILSGIVIGCLGIGLTLHFLQDLISHFVMNTPVRIHMVLSGAGIALSALICLLTVLLSAILPARRAAALSPIEAIRQSRDMELKAKDLKTGKRFHQNFAAMMAKKNYRRNRRRSRTCVLALFSSVVIFVSASAYSAYSIQVIDQRAGNGPDVFYFYSVDHMTPQTADLWKQYREIEGVTGFAAKLSPQNISSFSADRANFSEDYQKKSMNGQEPQADGQQKQVNGQKEQYEFDSQLNFIDDRSFSQLLKENGLSQEEYMNTSAPKGLLVNRFYLKDVKGEETPPLMKKEAFPLQISGKRMLNLQGEDARFDILPLTIGAGITKGFWFERDVNGIYYPVSAMEAVLGRNSSENGSGGVTLAFQTRDHSKTVEELEKMEGKLLGYRGSVYDRLANAQTTQATILVIKVFAYGFIILISLIAITNVFNIMSTGIILRQRELAMLRSVGMSRRQLVRMLSYECIGYGARALGLGLPCSVGISYLLYRLIVQNEFLRPISFFLPWQAMLIAVAVVFAVVLITMRYAEHKVSKVNLIDALKEEVV